MNTGNRPLSPHLQVYKPQVTSILSISHRMTGVAISIGALLLTYWLSSLAYGPEAFARAQAFMGSWFGILLLMGFSFCFFYHLCNGIRHLLWDTGRGFELDQVRSSAKVVIGAALVLTLLSWIAGFSA